MRSKRRPLDHGSLDPGRKLLAFKRANPFLFFVLFSCFWPTIQILIEKSVRCCAWDSNLGPQHGRPRRIHWPMTTAHNNYFLNVLKSFQTICGKFIGLLVVYLVFDKILNFILQKMLLDTFYLLKKTRHWTNNSAIWSHCFQALIKAWS